MTGFRVQVASFWRWSLDNKLQVMCVFFVFVFLTGAIPKGFFDNIVFNVCSCMLCFAYSCARADFVGLREFVV